MDEILNGYFLQVFTFVCINIILALTVYMTVCTGILSLGNAGFMSLGAYTSAIVTTQYGVPMPVGIVLGGLFATLIALIIGLPTIRLRGLYLAIATMGFGEVVRVIALNLDITHGALGFSGIPSMASVLSDYASDMGLLDALEIDLPDRRPASDEHCSPRYRSGSSNLLVSPGTFPHRPCLGCCEGR